MAQRVAPLAPVAPAGGGIWRKLKRFLFVSFALCVFASAMIAFMLLGMVQEHRKLLPSVSDLKLRAQSSGTKIFTQDGQLLAEFTSEHREWVPLRDIPEVMKKATIAIEDERFHHHRGADFIGIARALVQNARHREVRQGGSTIPEQLAKLIYLSERMYERSFNRRLTQMLLSLEIEKKYSKDEILETYLNKVYYGSGAYGVQAAAKLYFTKEVGQIEAGEAAMIAAITKNPERLSPFEEPLQAHQEAARARRNLVLTKMAEQGYLAPEQAQQAKQQALQLARPRLFGNQPFRAPHFAMHVWRLLKQKYSEEELRSGGFSVYTTLNMDMQVEATRAIKAGLEGGEARNVSQSALTCLDPRSGHILAMVGGRDFFDKRPEAHGQMNRATQSHRQPGSSFKIYDYTAAIELLGKTPDSTVVDSPVSIMSGGKSWSPKNYDGKFGGAMTYRSAFAQSRNVPAVKVAREVGIDNVIRTARVMGIRSRLNPYLPVALGADGLTMLEHTSAVGVIAAGGLRAEPIAIERIVRQNGEVVEQHSHPVTLHRVISKQTADFMQEMMEGVVQRGTGTRAKIADLRVCGKTGTTNKHADVWFVGFTPDLVAAVWMGNDDPSEAMYKGTTGGHMCAPIWKAFMEKAQKIFHEQKLGVSGVLELQTLEAEPPAGEEKPAEAKPVALRICEESGLIARNGCPHSHREKFAPEDRPREKCDLHEDGPQMADVVICQESGQLASEFCQHRLQEHLPKDEAPRTKCELHDRRSEPEPSPAAPPGAGGTATGTGGNNNQ